MNPRSLLARGQFTVRVVALASLAALVPLAMGAPKPIKGPTGKIYIVATEGESQVVNAGKMLAPTPKSVFAADGAQLSTASKGTLAIVFSNGVGGSLSSATKIEVKHFTQEPFTSDRTDLEREPSVSHTVIAVEQGIFTVSTSRLDPESTLTFLTALGSFKLRDGNLVIEADGASQKFFLLGGAGTALGGTLDVNGHVLHAGEEAILLPGLPGQPNNVQIASIQPGELPRLEALVAPAYAARRTVFFQSDDGELTPVPVVPVALPVEAAVSPSKLPN